MLADVPSGWKEARVGDAVKLCVRRRKINPSVDYPLLGVRLYGNGVFHRETKRGSDLSGAYVYQVAQGDLIYTRLFASKGTFAIVPPEFDGFYTSNEFPVFGLQADDCDLRFILENLIRERTWRRVEDFCTGTTTGSRFRLNERDFLKLPIVLPPHDEQVAIAGLLMSVRDQIKAAEVQLERLVLAKRDAMRRLLTLGMKGDTAELTPLKENWVLGRIAEGVEAIPKDWRLVQLTKHAKLESGHTPSRNHPEYWEGDIPWVSLADTDRFDAPRLLETTETIGDLGLKHSSARLLPEGTVVFSRTATVGKAAILGRPMATSQDFADWVCGPKLSPRYLLQVFRHMTREWKRLQAGSTHQTIYMPTFKKLQILLPPFDEQEAIADVGEAFDQRIAAERTALDELRASKDALAQELLSGRVRLPEATIRRLASTDHAEAS